MVGGGAGFGGSEEGCPSPGRAGPPWEKCSGRSVSAMPADEVRGQKEFDSPTLLCLSDIEFTAEDDRQHLSLVHRQVRV